jgi:hypothetical protein
MAARSLELAAAAAPVLFAVPVAYAIAASLVDVVGAAHPFFGDLSGTTTDARAFQLGNPLYQSPDIGYTPLVYTPLTTLVSGGLDAVRYWDGWTVLLTVVAVLALIALGAKFAYRGGNRSRSEGAAAVAGAFGMGAFAFWLVSFVPFNFLYAPRPDQLAWALALVGLCCVPAAGAGSRRAAVAAILCLSAGVWAKQPAVVAALAAVGWLWLATFARRVAARRAVLLTGALFAVNAAVFLLLHLTTDGWSTTFIVELPAERGTAVSVGRSLHDLAESVSLAAIVTAALWAVLAYARRTEGGRTESTGHALGAPAVQVAAVLALFAVLDAPAAVIFRRAIGAAHNQFIGIAWALGLLTALAWGLARSRRIPALAAAGVVVAMFVVSESSRLAGAVDDVLPGHVPAKEERAYVVDQPAALRTYARDHLVYHPVYSAVGARHAGDIYPGQDNVQGLVSSGRYAGYLERALLDRRFQLVFPFENNAARGDRLGYGRWEANYLWKLDTLIATKYQPATGLPVGVVNARLAPRGAISPAPLVPRPGPDPAPWMRYCFGPFKIAGIEWRIAAGGGFWCRPGGLGSRLELRLTPASISEIRADHVAVRTRAVVPIEVRRPAAVEVQLADRLLRRRLAPRKPWAVVVPAGFRGAVAVRAERDSGAIVDLGHL